ncbi:2-acylglycerol O-acyltransferase 2 isoform X6 [Hippoglossus stenolepis]|uniref:2-acylglycerol O-acyltransferase 2 isoform X6 n=1 Tax=Hippoglossus stenolepis TaxID=195615 RepID=UPI001FAFCB24|nr:2-acylglycerol O-acyltransferase 2 isoform X6 [Hippoglossus stenolepis]
MKIEFAPMNVPLRRRLGGSTVDVLLPGSRCSGGGGAFGNFCTESTGFSRLFPGLTSHLLMLPFWFRVPLFREYIMSGVLCPQNQLQSIMGFAVPLFHARGVFQYSLGLMPYRKSIHTVVGKPISVAQTPCPSSEDIESLHQVYLTCLKDLFEQNKHTYGFNDDQHLTFK